MNKNKCDRDTARLVLKNFEECIFRLRLWSAFSDYPFSQSYFSFHTCDCKTFSTYDLATHNSAQNPFIVPANIAFT
jgi:hypothetical protein